MTLYGCDLQTLFTIYNKNFQFSTLALLGYKLVIFIYFIKIDLFFRLKCFKNFTKRDYLLIN